MANALTGDVMTAHLKVREGDLFLTAFSDSRAPMVSIYIHLRSTSGLARHWEQDALGIVWLTAMRMWVDTTFSLKHVHYPSIDGGTNS